MKKTTLTIVETGKENFLGDILEEIVSVGYDEVNARQEALKALRYACCSDFTIPSACATGTLVSYYKAEGVEITPENDVDEIVNEMGWDYGVEMSFKNTTYVLPSDFRGWDEGGSFASSEVRKHTSWHEFIA